MKYKRIFIIILAAALVLSLINIDLNFKAPQKEDMYYYLYASSPSEDEDREFEVAGKYFGNGVSYGVAIMLIDLLESGEYEARVLWGPNSTQYTEWTMTLQEQPDGRWTYNDCECNDVTVDEYENLTFEKRYSNGSGYFVKGNWCFLWTGAQETGCRSIIFEK